MTETARAIIVANGSLEKGPAVERVLTYADSALRIAANGGTFHWLALGYTPHVVIGDLDSLDPDDRGRVLADGAEVIPYSPRKDETDLELALLFAAGRGSRWIRVLAATGDRLDQSLANVLLLTLPELAGLDVRLVTARQEAWVIREHSVIWGREGDTLSLIPLGGDARGVRSLGLGYPLRGETLTFGPARGISNVLTGSRAEVWVREGVLLAVFTEGRA